MTHTKVRRALTLSSTTSGHTSLYDTLGLPPQETWEWDGIDWYRFYDPSWPHAADADCTTDPFTNEVFLLAAKSPVMPYLGATTWRWNGKTWTRVLTPTELGDRVGELATDLVRKKIITVPYHTYNPPPKTYQDSWAFDGKDWQKIWQQTWPNGEPRAVYDPDRQEFVVYVAAGDYTADTWLYRMEEGWRQQTAANMPSGRWRPNMVGFGRSGPVLLFGGLFHNAWLAADEVFEWTGVDWKKRTYRPAPTSSHAVTVDQDRRTVQLMVDNTLDLWELDLQQGWRQLQQPDPRPPKREGTAICYDPARKRLVLFGGYSYPRSLGDTWEWDGRTWTQKMPAHSPRPQIGPFMTYVPALGGVVLVEGFVDTGQGLFGGTTWLWDGEDWREMQSRLPTFLIPTTFPAPALDSDRQRLFVFYGLGDANGGPAANLWFLEVDRLRASQPLPRPGESFSFELLVPGASGSWVVLGLSQGSYPGIPLPASASPYRVLPLAPDTLLQASLGMGLLTRLHAGGKGTVPFAIPNDAGLIGFRFEAAGLILDPGLRITDATNAVTIEVVR